MIDNVNENEAAPLFQPVRSGSVRSRVLETLREAIFSGKLRPGDPIREAHMARALQVSQPTVREALLKLEHAGLVVRNPNRDTVVTSLSPSDVRERAQLRVLLETQAAVAAAARMEERDFERLGRRLDEIHAALDQDSYLDYASADLGFHRLIWELSGNRMLYRVLDLITVPLFAFLSIRRSRSLKNLARSVHSHDPILAALRSRNAQAIAEAFQEHVEGSYRQFETEVPATAGGESEQ